MKQNINISLKAIKNENKKIKNLKKSKAFIEYSNNIQDVYKNIEECNSDREAIVLLVSDDQTAGMISSKRYNQLVTELFIRVRRY